MVLQYNLECRPGLWQVTHFLEEAPESSFHSLIPNIALSNSNNMQHVKVQRKSARLHCPSHTDICTVRLQKQARILSRTPTHPGHAAPTSPLGKMLVSSTCSEETNSFIPQAVGGVAPSTPAPPDSFQPSDSELIPGAHSQPRIRIMSHFVI